MARFLQVGVHYGSANDSHATSPRGVTKARSSSVYTGLAFSAQLGWPAAQSLKAEPCTSLVTRLIGLRATCDSVAGMLVFDTCHLADFHNVLDFRQPAGAFFDWRYPFFDVSHDDPLNHISNFVTGAAEYMG